MGMRLRACLKFTRSAGARDSGRGQGGEVQASPNWAVRAEPTPAPGESRCEVYISVLPSSLRTVILSGRWCARFGFLVLLAFSAGCQPAHEHPPPLSETEVKPTVPSSTYSANPSQILADPQKASSKAEAPLLLDDGPAEEEAVGGADNSRCEVCHINFMQEELTKVHAKADIGCAKCHGESDAHIADESWASGGNGTAPERMFPKNTINAFCLECHPRNKINAEAHKEFFAESNGQSVCVDCHGKHRMATRKCRWK